MQLIFEEGIHPFRIKITNLATGGTVMYGRKKNKMGTVVTYNLVDAYTYKIELKPIKSRTKKESNDTRSSVQN